MTPKAEAELFHRFATFEVAVGVAGLAAANWLPQTGEGRLGALVGVGTSILSAGLVLWLKRVALARSMQWVFGVIAASFFLRMVTLLAGLAVVVQKAAGRFEFVVSFLGVYVVCLAIELAYVLAARARGSGAM